MSHETYTPVNSEIELLVLKALTEPLPDTVVLGDITFYLDNVIEVENEVFGEYKPEQ